MSEPRQQQDIGRIAADAPVRSFTGRVWRVHWREVSPTDWSLSVYTSGRYNRGLDRFPPEQSWPALYTSLAPEVAIREMVRRSAARDLGYLRNNVLSELEVELGTVIDLSDPEVVGLTRADLTGPDHRLCQQLAAAVMAGGCQALLVPSAALPGSNLVVLARNLLEPLPIRVVRSTELPLDTIAREREEQ